MKRKTVGVLGGMGPEATVDFMASVIARTPAEEDQDHIHMIVDLNPGVPDRQAALHGDRRAVSQALTEMALRLEAAGADFLVMPCNTAHVFLADVLAKLHVPFIHIIEETVGEIAIRRREARCVGVLATTACVESGVYQSAILASGRACVFPPESRQRELMALVLRIKGGDKSEAVRSAMQEIAVDLVGRGAEIVIAGCTEIPLVLGSDDLEVPFISSTDVLARRTVAMAGA